MLKADMPAVTRLLREHASGPRYAAAIHTGQKPIRERPNIRRELQIAMASSKEFVSFKGSIFRDQEHVANCIVRAVKVTESGGGLSELTRQTIESVSEELLDGDYRWNSTEHIARCALSMGNA
jgi:hypothetical protein